MLERDKAYRLAGRRHHHDRHGCEAAALRKRREIRLHPLPPGQVQRAVECLASLGYLEVQPGMRANVLFVTYSLEHHSLATVEAHLSAAGLHLDGSLYARLMRAVVRYCEETQLRNLHSPERLIKKSNEVYVKAWEHHPHGDHDDTPAELREYR